ncbi:MAG: hypothetical protein HFI67_11730 [Lachnospiraceae bacterium]|nr:hypothetical protein [Lachnospiraceae bacterium]
MSKEERLVHLQDYSNKKIMELFAEGIPESLKATSLIYRTGISYEETETILEYTISQLKKSQLTLLPRIGDAVTVGICRQL